MPRALGRFLFFGLVLVGAEIGLQQIPEAGMLLSKLVLPVLAGGTIYAFDQSFRGRPVDWMALTRPMETQLPALLTVALLMLPVFFAQAALAALIAGPGAFLNLIFGHAERIQWTATAQLVILCISVPIGMFYMLALPAVVLGKMGGSEAVGHSFKTVARHFPAFLLCSLSLAALLALGIATLVGLLLVYPLMHGAAYMAWRDFGIPDVKGNDQDTSQ